MSNLINHPQHYNQKDRKECWTEMEEIFGKDSVIVFDVLNAYKYLYRAGEKPDNPKEQDLAKINTYMTHAYSLIEQGCKKEALQVYLAMERKLKESEGKQ